MRGVLVLTKGAMVRVGMPGAGPSAQNPVSRAAEGPPHFGGQVGPENPRSLFSGLATAS